MKFKMNSHEWEIQEEFANEIKNRYLVATGAKEEDIQEVYGLCDFKANIIYLNSECVCDVKRHTLMHELLHCYIAEYCSMSIDLSNEDVVCDLLANSHDIIHLITENYFKMGETTYTQGYLHVEGLPEKPEEYTITCAVDTTSEVIGDSYEN